MKAFQVRIGGLRDASTVLDAVDVLTVGFGMHLFGVGRADWGGSPWAEFILAAEDSVTPTSLQQQLDRQHVVLIGIPVLSGDAPSLPPFVCDIQTAPLDDAKAVFDAVRGITSPAGARFMIDDAGRGRERGRSWVRARFKVLYPANYDFNGVITRLRLFGVTAG